MENKTKELLINYRKEADFINERYGLGDEDHDTALDRGHIYDLMRQFALSSVVGRSEQCTHENEVQRQGNGFIYTVCGDCGEDLD